VTFCWTVACGSIFVHERADLHRVEVCHFEEHRAAAHVRGRRRDHRAQLDVLGDDRSRQRRPELRVVHAVARVFEIGSGADHRGVGVGVVQLGAIVFGLRDRLRLEQRVRARELRFGVAELRLTHFQVRLRLREVVARDARIDGRKQLILLHVVARLHVHPDDLARRLGLHVDGQHRLDGPGCRRRHHQVAAFHRNGFVRLRGLRLFAATPGKAREQQRRRGGSPTFCVHG